MPAINTSRITKRRIDSLKPGETIWDADVRGFSCRARPKRKLFYLKVRANGRQRWITIGEYGAPWTVETARREAQRLLGEIRNGIDVEVLRYRGNADDPTIEDLCTRFIEEHAVHHKRASSTLMDQQNISNHILPLIGKFAVKNIARSDIEKLKTDVSGGKTATKRKSGEKRARFGPAVKGGTGAANRCLALLSKMFNLAEQWGWRAEHTNPVRLVARYEERPRERYLSDNELDTLRDVLNTCDAEGSESPYATAAIRLLLLTGARRNEILTLKWEFVDHRSMTLLLPTSKSGKKAILLNDAAYAVLSSIPPVDGNPYVIVGTVEGQHLVNLQKPWARIRQRAALSDVRLHDLRHSFASIAASQGASLRFIGTLLGHTRPETTQRYAHLAAQPIREVNNRVGGALSGFAPPANAFDQEADNI